MSFWSWFGQRVSAVLLLLLLGLHLILEHFSPGSSSPTFRWIAARLTNPVYLALDIVFLATVLYHGLNGLGSVILDFGFLTRRGGVLQVGLWLLGGAAFILGLDIIFPLAGYAPWFSW